MGRETRERMEEGEDEGPDDEGKELEDQDLFKCFVLF
jgi:hypothetical protein